MIFLMNKAALNKYWAVSDWVNFLIRSTLSGISGLDKTKLEEYLRPTRSANSSGEELRRSYFVDLERKFS